MRWVQTFWSPLSGCDAQPYRLKWDCLWKNEDAYGVKWISSLETQVKGCCNAFPTNLFNAAVIFIDTHTQATMAALLYMTQLICSSQPPQRESLTTINGASLLITEALETLLDVRICRPELIHTCCLHNSLSICILSTSFRLSCSRWLFCLSSRM